MRRFCASGNITIYKLISLLIDVSRLVDSVLGISLVIEFGTNECSGGEVGLPKIAANTNMMANRRNCMVDSVFYVL